jgi:hypothetical protein
MDDDTLDESIAALPELVVAVRAGVCGECDHGATSAPQWVGLRRLLRMRILPARCGEESGAEAWAIAGGIGPIATCTCTNPFHAS